MVKNNEPSPEQARFHVGDTVKFKLEKQDFTGIIEKGYTNSFLVTFESTDPAIVDKYHNKVIINNKKMKIIKKAPREEKPEEDTSEDSKD